jgi:hypothetical protein
LFLLEDFLRLVFLHGGHSSIDTFLSIEFVCEGELVRGNVKKNKNVRGKFGD